MFIHVSYFFTKLLLTCVLAVRPHATDDYSTVFHDRDRRGAAGLRSTGDVAAGSGALGGAVLGPAHGDLHRARRLHETERERELRSRRTEEIVYQRGDRRQFGGYSRADARQRSAERELSGREEIPGNHVQIGSYRAGRERRAEGDWRSDYSWGDETGGA